MTDLEITKLCAEAMGLGEVHERHTGSMGPNGPYTAFGIAKDQHKPKEGPWSTYNPLRDDAQAMALVKSEKLCISWDSRQDMWTVGYHDYAHNRDLNRAICECVANMQQAKGR